MATYQEYLNQVTKDYEPTRQSVQQNIDSLAGQQQTALNDLNAFNQQNVNQLNQQKSDYDRQTFNTAGSRGLGWSNIASNYQADFNKNSYTPAMNNLQNQFDQNRNQTIQQFTQRRNDLTDYMNSLINQQQQIARNMFQADQDRAAQERAAKAAAAAQQAAMNSYYSAMTGGNNATGTMAKIADTGGANNQAIYKFTDPNGNKITAMSYAVNMGRDIRGILSEMAKNGE